MVNLFLSLMDGHQESDNFILQDVAAQQQGTPKVEPVPKVIHCSWGRGAYLINMV